MDLLVLKPHWDMGTLGRFIRQVDTPRPGQLWELFEHLGIRNNRFYLVSSILPERSCGQKLGSRPGSSAWTLREEG